MKHKNVSKMERKGFKFFFDKIGWKEIKILYTLIIIILSENDKFYLLNNNSTYCT